MSYVFVSHASEDKQQRVKPLVEALLIEGVKLWIDRPGHGESHFNFDQDFVERYGIESLKAGIPWDQQILEAHRQAGAVLGCLSRALCSQRQVLVQELVLARYANKLVACVVDDELPFSEVPRELGLIDGSKLQAPRINPSLLREAVDQLKKDPQASPNDFPRYLKTEWEIVRKLVSDINKILDRFGPRPPSANEISKIRLVLSAVPIGPMVRIYEVPSEVINIFADHFNDPEKAKNFVSLAMQILGQCNPENFEERQILVRSGEVLNPHVVPLDEYWSSVLTVAGLKSRRTLASLLMAPGAPSSNRLKPEFGIILENFRKWLEQPSAKQGTNG